jgi:hypothetical protein
VRDTSLDYVTSLDRYPLNQKELLGAQKKDKQGPSLAPQVKSGMLGRSSKEDT